MRDKKKLMDKMIVAALGGVDAPVKPSAKQSKIKKRLAEAY